MSNEITPEHMTPWDRNQRLYKFLKNMGLFVTPIPFDDDKTKISWIQVSAVMPIDTLEETLDRLHPTDDGPRPMNVSADESVPRDIRFPVEGSEVADVIASSVTDGPNVVDFPTEI